MPSMLKAKEGGIQVTCPTHTSMSAGLRFLWLVTCLFAVCVIRLDQRSEFRWQQHLPHPCYMIQFWVPQTTRETPESFLWTPPSQGPLVTNAGFLCSPFGQNRVCGSFLTPHNHALIFPRKPRLSSNVNVSGLPIDVEEVFTMKCRVPRVELAGSVAPGLTVGSCL